MDGWLAGTFSDAFPPDWFSFKTFCSSSVADQSLKVKVKVWVVKNNFFFSLSLTLIWKSSSTAKYLDHFPCILVTILYRISYLAIIQGFYGYNCGVWRYCKLGFVIKDTYLMQSMKACHFIAVNYGVFTFISVKFPGGSCVPIPSVSLKNVQSLTGKPGNPLVPGCP